MHLVEARQLGQLEPVDEVQAEEGALPLAERGESSVISAWLGRMGELYGGSPMAQMTTQTMRGMRGENRTTDAFAILGGRAALRETLQMQVLRPGAAGASRDATTPVDEMLVGCTKTGRSASSASVNRVVGSKLMSTVCG